jgi:copper chaperone CopZ
LLVFCVIAVAVSFGYKSSSTWTNTQTVKEVQKESTPNDVVENVSKLVLNVRGMSCSGCVATIKGAVSDFKGIEETLVDVGNGKVEIYYDNKRITDVKPIAQAITDSGYPANVQKIFSSEEMRKENALAAAKAQYYIASVGGYEIARADFDTELEVAKKRYSKIYGDNLFKNAQGESLLDNLKTQIISRLINEGIFMQEINRSGFRVDPKTLEIEMNAFLKEHGENFEKFKNTLKEVGYDPNYFSKKFETKVLMKRYLNEKILADASNDLEKQSLFNAWFSNAKTLAEVVYYDKNLERLVQQLTASKSCGGGS